MTDKKADLITAEQLHDAAYLVAKQESWQDTGLAENAVEEFLGTSTFTPPMDEVAISYGILIGVMSVKAKDSERSDDNGN